MALSDIAATLTDPASVPHRTCQVCHALAGMSPEDQATLRGLLADRGVRFTDLANALTADPESPSLHRDALSRHAQGQCAARENLR